MEQIVVSALEDLKAADIRVIDVTGKSPLTDRLVIASGNSSRHVKSMADKLVRRAREAGVVPLGVEGEREAEWILVDLNDVIVHLMLPRARAFYNLEKLWEVSAEKRASAGMPA
ncbi:MAG: ribosome silencing factor [Xanthomonadales bacterium]|nr:ribosome silencing factor [Xanthomonadales bacterium]